MSNFIGKIFSSHSKNTLFFSHLIVCCSSVVILELGSFPMNKNWSEKKYQRKKLKKKKMVLNSRGVILVLAVVAVLVSCSVAHRGQKTQGVTYDGRSLIVNGKRELLFSGSIHYPRSTPEVILLYLGYKQTHDFILFYFYINSLVFWINV